MEENREKARRGRNEKRVWREWDPMGRARGLPTAEYEENKDLSPRSAFQLFIWYHMLRVARDPPSFSSSSCTLTTKDSSRAFFDDA